MNRGHKQTLVAIFKKPTQSSVKWSDIEALLACLGAERQEGRGSRIRFLLNEKEAVFHRPHPRKETDKGALVSVRKFLEKAGIEP